MKAPYLLIGCIFVLCRLTPVCAQGSSRWTNLETITTYRIGSQGNQPGQLNDILQQAGYNRLPSSLLMLGFSNQVSKANQPWAAISEFALSTSPGNTLTNGTYKVQYKNYYIKVGALYKLWNTPRFLLAPQASLLLSTYNLQITPINPVQLPLYSVLTNPAMMQSASYSSGRLGIDTGLTAQLRFPYSQRQVDCSTIARAVVVGLDVGYRFVGQSALNPGAVNTTIQLSGWYAGVKIGVGTRVRSVPVRY